MKLTLHTLVRHDEQPLVDDDETGEALVRLVEDALDRGRPAPTTGVLVRPRELVLVSLDVLRPNPDGHPRAGDGRGLRPDAVHRLLGGLSRAEGGTSWSPPAAVALIGRVGVRVDPTAPPAPAALVFVEWPDGRWWMWRALLDPTTGRRLPDAVLRHRAIDGLPRPRGLGGWWTFGRNLPRAPRLMPETTTPSTSTVQ